VIVGAWLSSFSADCGRFSTDVSKYWKNSPSGDRTKLVLSSRSAFL
jgi:hypothetical protein